MGRRQEEHLNHPTRKKENGVKGNSGGVSEGSERDGGRRRE